MDSLEAVCPGQAQFEYPATSVLFSSQSDVVAGPDLELSLATYRVGTRSGTCWGTTIVLLLGMPGRPVAGSGRYRGLPEVHTLLRNPQVELVPCRPGHHGPGVSIPPR